MTTLRLALLAGALLTANAAQAGPAAPPSTWARCAVCHSNTKGAPDKIGPNLHGVYGHKMGVKGTYKFSDAVKKSGLKLDDATLDKWLESPAKLVPGNRMSFPGIKDKAKRAELIAYLKTLK
ncbi:MAG: c-type cytochrome [Novosphingobium sp.]